MKDQLEIIGRKLLKRLDIVGICVFAVILAVMGFLYMRENGAILELPEVTAVRPFEVKLPSDDSKKVDAAFVTIQPDISKDIRLRRLVQLSMFDVKSVRSEQQRESAVQQDYQDAEKLYEAKDYDGAVRRLDSILQRLPTHQRSINLKAKIERERQAPTAS